MFDVHTIFGLIFPSFFKNIFDLTSVFACQCYSYGTDFQPIKYHGFKTDSTLSFLYILSQIFHFIVLND